MGVGVEGMLECSFFNCGLQIQEKGLFRGSVGDALSIILLPKATGISQMDVMLGATYNNILIFDTLT